MAAVKVIATASRGCCPTCSRLYAPNEDGWSECPVCRWDFKVEFDLQGYAVLMCRQPGQIVTALKPLVVVGLMGFEQPDPNEKTPA